MQALLLNDGLDAQAATFCRSVCFQRLQCDQGGAGGGLQSEVCEAAGVREPGEAGCNQGSQEADAESHRTGCAKLPAAEARIYLRHRSPRRRSLQNRADTAARSRPALHAPSRLSHRSGSGDLLPRRCPCRARLARALRGPAFPRRVVRAHARGSRMAEGVWR